MRALTHRAVNSAVECHLHTVEATGSIPVPPTRFQQEGHANAWPSCFSALYRLNATPHPKATLASRSATLPARQLTPRRTGTRESFPAPNGLRQASSHGRPAPSLDRRAPTLTTHLKPAGTLATPTTAPYRTRKKIGRRSARFSNMKAGKTYSAFSFSSAFMDRRTRPFSSVSSTLTRTT